MAVIKRNLGEKGQERWLELIPTLGDYVDEASRPAGWVRTFNQNLTLDDSEGRKKNGGGNGGSEEEVDGEGTRMKKMFCCG